MRFGMGLGLGLGAQRGGGAKLDPATVAYLAAMGVSIGVTNQGVVAVDNLVKSLKENNLFDDCFDRFWVLALDTTNNLDTLVSLINPAATKISIMNGLNTFVTKQGWVGEAAKGLNSNYQPDGSGLFKWDNHHLSAYSLTEQSGIGKSYIGMSGNPPTALFQMNIVSGQISYGSGRTASAQVTVSPAVNTRAGLQVMSRTSSNLLTGYSHKGIAGGAFTNDTTIEEYYPSVPLYITCRNYGGINAVNPESRLAFTTAGRGLSSAENDILKNICMAYLKEIGTATEGVTYP